MFLRKTFFALALLCWAGVSVSAQGVAGGAQPSPTTSSAVILPEAEVSMPETDRLVDFSRLEISGRMNVRLKKVAPGETVSITYDLKGCITSKFKASVDKDGLLRIEERIDPKRLSTTDVTLYYDTLTDIQIAHATVVFEDTLHSRLLDLAATSGATVSLDVESLDMAVVSTGKSSLALSGTSRYFKLTVSTAKVDASGLQTVSAIVDASHSAEVRVTASERLEAITSTSAKLLYRGRPEIVRGKTSLFGGDIICID